jgi:hypothetical protein
MWDYFSAKYIEFIQSTYLGNYVKDLHQAYNILSQTDSDRRENSRRLQ